MKREAVQEERQRGKIILTPMIVTFVGWFLYLDISNSDINIKCVKFGDPTVSVFIIISNSLLINSDILNQFHRLTVTIY